MNTAIAHVRASDADAQGTVNSRIRYTLRGPGAASFTKLLISTMFDTIPNFCSNLKLFCA